MDRPGVRRTLEDSGEQGEMEKTGCGVICGALTTLAGKGLVMKVMMGTAKSRSEVQRYTGDAGSYPVKKGWQVNLFLDIHKEQITLSKCTKFSHLVVLHVN